MGWWSGRLGALGSAAALAGGAWLAASAPTAWLRAGGAGGTMVLVLLPVVRRRTGLWPELLTPAAVAAAAVLLGRAGAFPAVLTLTSMGGCALVGLAGNQSAERRGQPLWWDPEDVVAGTTLAGLTAHLWLGTLAPLLLVAAAGVAGAVLVTRRGWRAVPPVIASSFTTLLPQGSVRRGRYVLGAGGGQSSAYRALGNALWVVPLSLCPRHTWQRWQARLALDRAWLTTTEGVAAPWHVEAAWQTARAVSRRMLDPAAAAELQAELAELAFRAGRDEETVEAVEQLRRLSAGQPRTKAAALGLVHAEFLRAMAMARLGRVAEAAEAWWAAAEMGQAASYRLLRSLAEAQILFCAGETRDLVNRLRRSLPWADHELDQISAWWRGLAQVLAAEAALASGDLLTAQTYLAGTDLAPGPISPQGALVLARAFVGGGAPEQASEVLHYVLAHATSGPLAEEAQARLAALGEAV
ncbi:MAG: hypothetical protein HYU66_06275 [Armatimonadetes bacterium]|nr:hypothetical protein [Armatimonadota bacterium]